MDTKRVAFLTGVGVVVSTHLWLISASLPDAVKNQHAFINLAAAALIVYGST
jgi:hypothetical protein